MEVKLSKFYCQGKG